jgi:hypothetical protein
MICNHFGNKGNYACQEKMDGKEKILIEILSYEKKNMIRGE